GQRPDLAPILPEGAGRVKPAITLKRSVTETQGVASKPVLPTPPERGPRDGARTPRVCRGDAPAVSGRDEATARRNPGRVLPRDAGSSQGGDPPLGGPGAGPRAPAGASSALWTRPLAAPRAAVARQ